MSAGAGPPPRQSDDCVAAPTPHSPQLDPPPEPAANRGVYIETYGCQMNVADAELVASILAGAGYRIVETPEHADVILINTCAVRANAEQRVLGRASQLSGLREGNPGLTLGILGCMAQHLADDLSQRSPFVDLVVGPDSYQHLPDLLAQTSSEVLLDVGLNRAENYVGIDPRRGGGTNALFHDAATKRE